MEGSVVSDSTIHRTVTDALEQAAVSAGYAPSIHNTQPWRWRLADDTLDLFAEQRRMLDVTDPDGRLATTSCGATLHHARAALAALGWHAEVARLPDPADPGHLARLRVDGPAPAGPAVIRLAQSIPLRHTDRRPVTGSVIRPDELTAVIDAVEAQDTSLHVLRPDQVLDLAAATSHAQRAENAESQWHQELARWTGAGDPGIGLPDDVIPQAASRTTVPGRDFGHDGDRPVTGEHDRSAVFAVLYGPGDDRIDWLRAGEALSALWLTATGLRIAVLPFSAPIEMAGTREALRHLLAGLGHPYLALRLGHQITPDTDSPHTPRLPADQTVERSPG
jgi:nitroreductase